MIDDDIGEVDAVLDSIEQVKRTNPFIPHVPHEKQKEFLALDDLEALYGGAAGGGKSDALLMAALEHVDKPGYNGLLLRRTFRDLNQPKAIMNRCHAWMAEPIRDGLAHWSAQDKRYTFTKSGATLTFGYFDNEKDKDQYASAEYHFIGWDELTQFPEGWYTWMFSRLRREIGSKIPTKVRGGTNPGGIGHAWVQRRFVDAKTRQGPFIPALLDDNPFIDQAGYRESLAKLDPVTRAQLERGVWIRDSSGLIYYCYDEQRNNIYEYPLCTTKILGLDFGASKPTALVKLGWRANDPCVYILKAWKKGDISPSEVGEVVKDWNRKEKFERMIGDIGGLGKGYQLEMQRRFNLPIISAEKQDKLGFIKLFNGELERANIKVFAPDCEMLIKEWLELPKNEKGEEVPGFENHCADGALYGWRGARAYLLNHPNMLPSFVDSGFAKW